MTRYLFHNIYGDAAALLSGKPNDVEAVPFGWTAAAEATRAAAITTAGRGISAIPSLVYTQSSTQRELRILEMAKPWNWTDVNKAIAASFSVSMVGDSLISQMGAVQASMPAPITTAQNLGSSGTQTPAIRTSISSVSGSANRLVIDGGVNNLIAGNGAQALTDWQAMINMGTSSRQIIAMGIVPVQESLLNPSYLPAISNANIAAFNAQIVSMCSAASYATPALQVMAMDMTGLTTDGMHFKDAASYQVMVNKLIASL